MRLGLALTRRRLLRVVALLVAVSIVAPDVASAGPDSLQVWTANLRKMNHLGSPRIWKKFVRKVDNLQRKPDIIALNEVCNNDFGGTRGNDAGQFVRFLEDKIKVNYEYRHAGYRRQPCTEANSMIVWRGSRFDLARRPRFVRWYALTDKKNDGNYACTPNDGHNLRQIAAALWDRRQKKVVVAASLHVQVINARRCINENVVTMDRLFEKLRRKRALTIVAGDFNQTPQRESPEAGDETAAGLEVDPSCWYRSMSVLTVSDRRQCPANGAHRLGHYAARTDKYIDAVRAQNHGPLAGTTESGICDEWTHTKSFAGTGTACTDISGERDRPDGLADRGRIDYIFARWERKNGKPREFDHLQAQDMIKGAFADKTQPPRYSDHRAVRARIFWCLPEGPCRH